MLNNNFYSRNQIEKLGNAIIFFAERMPLLSKTKVLKLLYLTEEFSIKKYGIPFFGIDFQLWKLGPVAKDVFIDLSSTPTLLDDFIELSGTREGTYIVSKKNFSDDEFSDADVALLNFVTGKFKDATAQELVKLTHRENYPWHATAKSLGYLELFEKNLCNSTDIILDLSSLLENSPELREAYLSTLDFQKQSNHLKRVG